MGLMKHWVSTKGQSPWYYYMRKKLFCEGKTMSHVNINRIMSSVQPPFLSSALVVSRTNSQEFLLLSWACVILQKLLTSVYIPNILMSWDFGLVLLYRLWHISCGTYCPALCVPPTCPLLSMTQMGEKTQSNPKHFTRISARTSLKDAKNIYSRLNSLLLTVHFWKWVSWKWYSRQTVTHVSWICFRWTRRERRKRIARQRIERLSWTKRSSR